MSAKTVLAHSAAELSFVTMDEYQEIAFFHSLSKSNPDVPNVTALDVTTNEVYCFCKGYACGKDCWHCGLIFEAWALHQQADAIAAAEAFVSAAATLADVEAIGRQAKARIAAVGSLWALVSPLDAAILDAARIEYRKRRSAAASVVALPVAARREMAVAA